MSELPDIEVVVVVTTFAKCRAAEHKDALHLVPEERRKLTKTSLCGKSSPSGWLRLSEGGVCTDCIVEAQRRHKQGTAEQKAADSWMPDTSRTCPCCGCSSIVDGKCSVCGALKAIAA